MKAVKDKQILMAADFAGVTLKNAVNAHLEKKEPVKAMVIPVAVLACLSLLLGIFCGPLVQYAGQIAEVML